MSLPGPVVLVGAGPGDPDLITVRGLRWLRRADVVVFDRLAPSELLAKAPAKAEFVDVGKVAGQHKLDQDEIGAFLVDRAKRGAMVVRLKGGDPFIFGRATEEIDACRNAGIDVVVVPGVSSAIAGPAAVGVPLTERAVSRSFAVLTGRTETGGSIDDESLRAAYRADTAVFLMSRANLGELMRRLIEIGEDPATPAMCVERATTCDQRVTVSTVSQLAEAVEQDGLCSPMLTVVGPTVARAVYRGPCRTGSLVGRSILLTCTKSTAKRLRRLARAAGARAVYCPLIAIEYPETQLGLDEALARLGACDWAVFPSVHAVRGLVRSLLSLGADVRVLNNLRLAAIGKGTASALSTFGLRADFVSPTQSADGLADALCNLKLGRVLYPCSEIARMTLPDRLRGAGAVVECFTAYRTVPVSSSAVRLRELARCCDATVFCSPSAVREYAAIAGGRPSGVVACIGSVTAASARTAGISPQVVAQDHSARGLIAALDAFFASEETAK